MEPERRGRGLAALLAVALVTAAGVALAACEDEVSHNSAYPVWNAALDTIRKEGYGQPLIVRNVASVGGWLSEIYDTAQVKYFRSEYPEFRDELVRNALAAARDSIFSSDSLRLIPPDQYADSAWERRVWREPLPSQFASLRDRYGERARYVCLLPPGFSEDQALVFVAFECFESLALNGAYIVLRRISGTWRAVSVTSYNIN